MKDEISFRDAIFGCRDGVHDDTDAEDLAEGASLCEMLPEGGVERRSLSRDAAQRALDTLVTDGVIPKLLSPKRPRKTLKPGHITVVRLGKVIPFPKSRRQAPNPPPNSAA